VSSSWFTQFCHWVSIMVRLAPQPANTVSHLKSAEIWEECMSSGGSVAWSQMFVIRTTVYWYMTYAWTISPFYYHHCCH
jgi:hypothetical protein